MNLPTNQITGVICGDLKVRWRLRMSWKSISGRFGQLQSALLSRLLFWETAKSSKMFCFTFRNDLIARIVFYAVRADENTGRSPFIAKEREYEHKPLRPNNKPRMDKLNECIRQSGLLYGLGYWEVLWRYTFGQMPLKMPPTFDRSTAREN